MTVTTTTSDTLVTGNGAQTVFTYAFEVPSQAAASLYMTDTSGNVTLLTAAQWTMTGAGNPTGGTFTYPAAGSGGATLATGWTLRLVRNVPNTQPGALGNQSGYAPSAVENMVDWAVLQVQDLVRRGARALRAADSDGVVAAMPPAATRASKYLAFDASGNPIAAAAPVGTTVPSTFGASLMQAIDAAAARLLLGITLPTSFGALLNACIDAAAARTLLGVSQPLIGSGMVFYGPSSQVPAGYLMAYGQNVSRTTYAALFALIGTTYGSGDGSTTFTLPDARGRVLAGKDDMGGTAANRLTLSSGVGGTTLGATGGNQMQQSHTHTLTDPGHTHSVAGGNSAFANAATLFLYPATTGGGNYIGYGTPTVSSSTTGASIASYGAGSSQNVQPVIVVNYLIYAGV